MRKFQPIPNVTITCATCPTQAEQIVNFLNSKANDLPCGSFYVKDGCVICVTSIKASQIAHIQGVIVGHLLTK